MDNRPEAHHRCWGGALTGVNAREFAAAGTLDQCDVRCFTGTAVKTARSGFLEAVEHRLPVHVQLSRAHDT
jgi:hypothetical protein